MFAAHGLPRTVVSDNGSVFTSSEFQTKNVHHIRTALYQPVSNNLAERVIQTLTEGLRNSPMGVWKPSSSISCFNTELHLILCVPLINPCQLNSY